MPAPFMVRLMEETWESDGNSWSFYVREEVEPSTYDATHGKKALIQIWNRIMYTFRFHFLKIELLLVTCLQLYI